MSKVQEIFAQRFHETQVQRERTIKKALKEHTPEEKKNSKTVVYQLKQN